MAPIICQAVTPTWQPFCGMGVVLECIDEDTSRSFRSSTAQDGSVVTWFPTDPDNCYPQIVDGSKHRQFTLTFAVADYFGPEAVPWPVIQIHIRRLEENQHVTVLALLTDNYFFMHMPSPISLGVPARPWTWDKANPEPVEPCQHSAVPTCFGAADSDPTWADRCLCGADDHQAVAYESEPQAALSDLLAMQQSSSPAMRPLLPKRYPPSSARSPVRRRKAPSKRCRRQTSKRAETAQ
ncbi:hypothetical protein NKR23_g12136 [Pleurostoma richardsiae]|uniref:Uncharacterized protein n=1 Tax=Pleurostoma richardsiae TaxID=41990 RepID=A0AA38VJ00_9PEZI|nr:hypothetical protein NKR23_g12136 [Pleurostoma richardsiae]